MHQGRCTDNRKVNAYHSSWDLPFKSLLRSGPPYRPAGNDSSRLVATGNAGPYTGVARYSRNRGRKMLVARHPNIWTLESWNKISREVATPVTLGSHHEYVVYQERSCASGNAYSQSKPIESDGNARCDMMTTPLLRPRMVAVGWRDSDSYLNRYPPR